MIPKIIHYCWFGRALMPKNLKSYVNGWQEKFPDYQIIEWNESNFNIESAIPYVKEAYAAKKFAFVSDYVRIWALYTYGGVYFDTDVEVLQSFDEYLDNQNLVLGFEFDRLLATAVIASSKNNEFMKGFLNTYSVRHFIRENGEYDMSTINEHLSAFAEQNGLDLNKEEIQQFGEGMIVYPSEFFSGFDIKNWHPKVTKNTCTIHHMNSSWVNSKKKMAIIKFLQKILGYKNYDKIKAWVDIKIRKRK